MLVISDYLSLKSLPAIKNNLINFEISITALMCTVTAIIFIPVEF